MCLLCSRCFAGEVEREEVVNSDVGSALWQLMEHVTQPGERVDATSAASERETGVSQILLVNLLLTTTVEIPLPM